MRRVLVLAGFLLVATGLSPVPGNAQTEPPVLPPDSVTVDTTGVGHVPQRDAFDLINKLLGRDMKPELTGTGATGLSWALLPTISYNPVYGVAAGLMATGAGQRGSRHARYSSLSLSGNVSTTGQIQAQVRGDLFNTSGTYLVKADFRYLNTERSTWGLGAVSEDQQEYPMEYVLYRVYSTFYRVVSGPVFAGLGYHYDEFADIVDKRAVAGEPTPFTVYSGEGVTRTVASGFSLNLLGDTRDNLVNPSTGYYLSVSFRNYMKSIGSDHNWQEMWAEMRVYPHVPKPSRNVLGFWLYTWLSFGPAPYLNKPSSGWDTYGRGARGYLQGRIRGPNQLYLEAEYRRTLTADGLWGAVVFLNLTCTTNPDTQTFGSGDPGAGIGLRVKFNKRANTNLTIDYGRGRNGSDGFFLGMSETF